MKNIMIKKKDIYLFICSIIFAVFIIIGKSYNNIGTFNFDFENLPMNLLNLIMWIFIIYSLLKLCKFCINEFETLEIKIKGNRINNFFSKHIFIVSLIVIIGGWLIYIIAFYPTIMTIDGYNQLKQFFNIDNIYSDSVNLISKDVLLTNHHPVLHTITLGGFLRIGQLIGNDNFGLFLYTILQVLILATTLTYSIKYLKKAGVKNRFLYILLFIYIFVPAFPFYAITATKDTIYTAFILLYIIEIHKFTNYARERKITKKEIISFVSIMILVCLMRNNGIYVVALSFLPVIFYSRKNIKRCLLIFAVVVSLYILYIFMLLPTFKISGTSAKEALSIPFQQTARYVKYYYMDVTKEESEKISKVLNYENLYKLYIPKSADPVKETYNKNASKEDLLNYFDIWIKQYKKHPNVYWDSFIEGNYGYFYPKISDTYLYTEDLSQPFVRKMINFLNSKYDVEFMNYTHNGLGKLRIDLIRFGKNFKYVPIVNVAINNWVIIVLVAYCISNNKKNILILLPSIISILVCIASPLDNCFRYAMPIIFANPLVFLLIKESKKI